MLIFIIGLIVWGFVVGALARLALPGPDPMPWYATIGLGLGGSLIGGILAKVLIGERPPLSGVAQELAQSLPEEGRTLDLAEAPRLTTMVAENRAFLRESTVQADRVQRATESRFRADNRLSRARMADKSWHELE